MAHNIRPAGVFDTTYEQDIALNRTRWDKIGAYGGVAILLVLPFLTLESPLGVDVVPDIWVGLIRRIAILVIAVQGLNLLLGYTGQISLGHAAFMAVGAYSSAILARELGMSFWLALPVSALLTGFVGLLFGLPSLRVKGFYLAMATLAAQFIIPWVLRYPLEPYTNGARPLTVPPPMIGPFSTYAEASQSGETEVTLSFEMGDRILVDILNITIHTEDDSPTEFQMIFTDQSGIEQTIPDGEMTIQRDDNNAISQVEYTATKSGTYTAIASSPQDTSTLITLEGQLRKALSFGSDFAMYYLILPLAVLLMLFARNIIRTRTGRAFISIRDNDLAAELLGINVFGYKLRAFFLSSVYAGIAGCLIAFESNSLSLAGFQLDRSIELLAMLIIGGAGFPKGAIFGAGFYILLSQFVVPTVAPFLREFLPQLLPFMDAANIQSAINPLVFGLVLIVFLILEPRGLAYRWEILKVAWKIRPFSQH